MNKMDERDVLVQLAILHAEFEALHPFLDGNGRLGRILVPLFLWNRGIIREPLFYISAYLEENREDYYNGLLSISRDDDWTGWCVFFLEAIRVQAEDNLVKAERIIELYQKMKIRIDRLTRSRHTINTLDWIFKFPVFGSSQFIKHAGIPERTSRNILHSLRDNGILQEIVPGRGRAPSILLFQEVLDIANEGVSTS